MTALELLAQLKERGIAVAAEGGQLKVRAPRDAVTDDVKTWLAAHKPELLRLLQAQTSARRPQIQPRPQGTAAPASFTQQRFWFLEQLEPATGAHHLFVALKLEGRLDVGALQSSLEQVVRRHEVLRTRFELRDSVLLQLPCEAAVDLLRLEVDPDEAADAIPIMARRHAQQPFNLESGSLVRATLVHVTDREHVLMVAIHHIAADVWSVGLFVNELAAGYAAAIDGRPAALSPLPIQYGDYAAWQVERGGGQTESDVAYWRRQLAGAPMLELPTDRARPAQPSYRGARVPMAFSRADVDGLTRLAHEEGATLYMSLLAGLAVVLGRHAGQDEIVVGSPIAGRDSVDVEPLIGPFINSLVLRVRTAGRASFRELLRHVRDVAFDAYAHQATPFERLVQEIQPERQASRTPFFGVVLALQNVPLQPMRLPDLAVTLLDIDRGTVSLDQEWFLWETPDGLGGQVRYSTELFDEAAVSRAIAHFKHLLSEAVARPDAPLDALSLMDDAERRLVTVDWNATAAPLPEAGIHQLVERQVQLSPEAEAVCGDGASITYAELNASANRLAHALRALGVGPDTPVGVCLPRSTRVPPALLGVLKAGGAYVPLDPAYPVSRLAFMLSDLGIEVVVTEASVQVAWPEGTHVLRLEDVRDTAPSQSENVSSLTGLDHLAYVNFTSGSTGAPKGVAIPHRGVVRLLTDPRYTRLDSTTRLLHLSPASFDASTLEIWGPLMHGGCCVVFEGPVPTAAALRQAIAAHRVTTAWLTAALFNTIVDDAAGALTGLRDVLTGGEALSVRHVRAAMAALPDTRIVNGYGPTESTTFTCCHRIPRELPADARSVPIGTPIGNTRVYVLDGALRPVPVGVRGELYIGGDGLARGYLNRPSLTAERFVPDPFGGAPGARLYRTGDLVEWRPDGTIEFVRRVDHQVKVRGFRIELGEIESVLGTHPDVRECTVIVREDTPGDRRVVAYAIPQTSDRPPTGDVRAFLKAQLPDYMRPSAIVWLDRWPLNANGKIERQALPAPVAGHAQDGAAAPAAGSEQQIAAVWRDVLGVSTVGADENFFDLGGHSLLLVQVQRRLAASLGRDIPIVEMFQFPTVRSLAAHLGGGVTGASPAAGAVVKTPAQAGGPIAIVGMAGRFPGAKDVAGLWTNLLDGVESISRFTVDELAEGGVSRALADDPNYVPARGVLEDADRFDAALFGYTPREAELIDPQQRVFLECAWEALESAGCDPDQYGGRIGVFAGTGFNSYLSAVAAQPGALDGFGGVQLAVAGDKDFLATRVSYKLNLRGPSLAVQTACSTSLVATHLACQSLRAGDCDVALAGGVRIAFPQTAGYLYQDGSILSPDGHCRPFDAAAQGTVSGSGAAIVVLKRLEDALADGDTIVAVIRGSAVNNDGSQKVGFTAPGVDGQASAIAEAQRASGVDPSTIGYVEAHGTGTSLGDPVEIAALTSAFRRQTDRVGYCAIGSLKSNVGHLDAAAGAAGLIKAALAVQQGEVPPSLHFERPNPAIDFAGSPFIVATTRQPWPAREGPRRAAVSSFGLGGTNAHVVLEEAPKTATEPSRRSAHLLVVSAATEAALDESCRRLSSALAGRRDDELADIAYTLQMGRRALAHRRAIAARSIDEAADALTRPAERGAMAAQATTRRGVAFMFSGQGAQHLQMARGVYGEEPVFREHLDACAGGLEPHLGFDLRRVLYPEAGAEDEAGRRLNETAVTQPALFAVEYALAQLWMSWGVRPEAMIGHSIGEYVAACLAGVFSFEDALALVAARGRLMQAMPPGDMLAVPMTEPEAAALAGSHVSVAAVNAPEQVVLSGAPGAIADLAEVLRSRGIDGRILPTSHAFHSHLMEAMLEPFAAEVARVRLSAPQVPYVSNVTGTWIRADEATSPDYWVRHLRGTVRFADGVRTLTAGADRVLLEVGPGHSLAALARRSADATRTCVVASLPGPRRDADPAPSIVEALGRAWCAGVPVGWSAVHRGERRQRVPLPTYPFERQRYWLAGGGQPSAATTEGRLPLEQWLYSAGWAHAPRTKTAKAASDRRWLVFEDRGGLGAEIGARARAAGLDVVSVTAGSAFTGLAGDRCTLDVNEAGDYDELWSALLAADRVPDRVVHLWSLDAGHDDFDRAQALGLYSVWRLLDARAATSADPLELTAITSGVGDVTGVEPLRAGSATVLAACKVAPHEHDNLVCRAIDVDSVSAATARFVVDELRSGSTEATVAYRSGRRWLPTYTRVPLPEPADSVLRDGGVYLITGGTGGVGLEIAVALAQRHRASIALVSRRELPARELWADWLSSREDDEVSHVLKRVLEIEAAGGRVLLQRADVADEGACRDAVARTVEEFGALHGVIHAAGADKARIPMAQLREEDWAAQFAPRVGALQALERALEGLPLDFCVMHSSLSSVLGVVGHCAYTAAHLFVDAFVAEHNRRSAVQWKAIDWDNWLTRKSATTRRAAGDLVMTADEGVEVLERVLGAVDLPHVVVSTGDLEARRRRWTRTSVAAAGAAAGDAQTRPALSTAFVAPRTDRERVLCGLWERLLGVAPVGVDDNFFELGGDSVVGIQVVAQAAGAGLRLSARQVFEHPTIAGLALALTDAVPGDGRPAATASAGPVPLTPIQHWFLEQRLPRPYHFAQSRMVEVRGPLAPAAIEEALAHVIAEHDALRLRFERDGGSWRQTVGKPEAPDFAVVDLSALHPADRERQIEREADAVNRALDLQTGRLVIARLFESGNDQPARLLVVAHHLVVDVISWGVLLEDLAAACRARAAGATPPARTAAPFADWARSLEAWARTPAVAEQAPFWERQTRTVSAIVPRDIADGVNDEGSRGVVDRVLGADVTARLFDRQRKGQARAVDVLVTALVTSCLEWSGGDTLRVDLEGHGREDIGVDAEFSRTIGWFTAIHPVALSVEGVRERHRRLDAIRGQLEAVPQGGLGYGALRYLTSPVMAERLTPATPAEVSFLYVGRQSAPAPEGTLFRAVPPPASAGRDPQGRRHHVLEVTAYVVEGQMHIQLAYSRNLHRPDSIDRLADRMIEMAADLAHDAQPAAQPAAPAASHFPGARLNQQQMDTLMSKLRRPGRTDR